MAKLGRECADPKRLIGLWLLRFGNAGRSRGSGGLAALRDMDLTYRGLLGNFKNYKRIVV
jgi:hypothetical protein